MSTTATSRFAPDQSTHDSAPHGVEEQRRKAPGPEPYEEGRGRQWARREHQKHERGPSEHGNMALRVSLMGRTPPSLHASCQSGRREAC
jgi:hypothetical protein